LIHLYEAFKQAGIHFERYHHRAIYTNEDAVIVKHELGFFGTETKSLFLKSKDNQYYIFLTYTTKRTDFKALSKLVGKRLSIVSSEQMQELTGQSPGAVSPFGYPSTISLIIDSDLLREEKWVFAPGKPDETFVLDVKDYQKVIALFQNPLLIFKEQEDV
jgi:Ala-tRNA(Pro) deacylase